MVTTASRMVWLARLLLAVAVALVLGAMVIPEVEATKKGKNTITSINKRVNDQRHNCETLGGGTLDVRTLPSGTKITYCEGGKDDGARCRHTKKQTFCRHEVTSPPQEPTTGGSANNAGGGATVPPPSEADPGDGESAQPILQ